MMTRTLMSIYKYIYIYYMDVSETGIFAQMSALMGKMMETVVKHDQSQ